MVSMLVGRRPAREDTVIFGQISPSGDLFAALGPCGTKPWEVSEVAACAAQGIRRVVLCERTALPPRVRASAAQLSDGQPVLEFVTVTNMLDALAHVFDAPPAPSGEPAGQVACASEAAPS
jgi:hypothetical protein